MLSYTPVEVQVRHFVCESLDLVSIEARTVADDIVGSGRHRALADGLGYNEEIVPKKRPLIFLASMQIFATPFRQSDSIIDNCAKRSRILLVWRTILSQSFLS
jgi:hypothetical protein